MEPNSVLAEELQNLDLDSDSSFISQEFAHFDREKLLELAFEKDQALEEEKFNFISFNQLMGLEESDEANIKMEKTNMISKIQKLSRRINYSLLLTKWEC